MAVDAEATRRRFDRERKAMGRLSQAPGIAPLYGSGFTPSGQPWLLMPYYENGSLQQVLDDQGPLDPERVRTIGVRICRAVHAAHESGVLHRDLKPANVLVKRSGQPDVADFGIAHLLDDTHGQSQALTMTPLYTAPEIFDDGQAGPLGDVYSLGALLYALLRGRPAFAAEGTGSSMLALMRRIHEDPIPPLPAHVPPDLAAIVTQAMSKDPAQRPASAAAFADALAAASLAPGVAPEPTQRLQVPAPTPAAHPQPLVPRSQGPDRTPDATGKRGLRTGRLVALIVAALTLIALVIVGIFVATRSGGDESASSDNNTVEPTVSGSDPDTDGAGVATPTPISISSSGFEAALASAELAVVQVEGFSCTGAETAVGVVLADGRVLTDASILRSPWYVAVTTSDRSVQATPETMDLNRSLGLLQIPAGLAGATQGTVGAGDTILFVENAGTTFETTVQSVGGNLVADLAISDAVRVDHGTPAFNRAGELVAVAIEGEDQVGVLPITDFEFSWNRIPPRDSCPSVVRDLGAADASQATSPVVAELLTLQGLSDAFADEEWDQVREIEPGKSSYTDAEFVSGWRPLRQGFVFPLERSQLADGQALWRLGLIGHETWDGTDLTTLFCVSWQIDSATGTVVQTNDETIPVFGSRPELPRQNGFVDPAELVGLIFENCPL